MTSLRNLILPVIIAFMAVACKTGKENPLYSHETEERISRVENSLAGWVQMGYDDKWTLAERMKKYNAHGVSIAVIRDYKIEWARGYGYADMLENRKVSDRTLFQAASISKSLNSLGLMKLVQEGKVDPDNDINEYLVTWKFPYDEKSNGKKITLKHLLSHTAGLTLHGFPGYHTRDQIPSLQQILDGKLPANTEPVRSFGEPGKRFSYSGGGTTISQLIVTDVTKEPYDEYMKKNVLKPLGMKASTFTQPPPPSAKALLATGYRADGNEVLGKYHVYPEQAAAGLWTTPSDLARYVIETQLSYKGESSKVLTPEMTRLRLTPVADDAALGSFVNSRVTGSFKYFNHNGGNEGFSCTAIGCLDSGDGVVVMTNTDNGPIVEEIVNSVATVYGWKDYYLPETKKVIDIDETVAAAYAGEYDLEGQKVSIRMGESGLVLNAIGDSEWPVYFTSDTEFFIMEFRGYLKFQLSPDGTVTGFAFNSSLAKKVR